MKRLGFVLAGLTLTLALGWVMGCAEPSANVPGDSSAPPVDGSKYVLAAQPDGAKEVIQVREDAKDGDNVVIEGRIGGDVDPWIEGRAAFTIVDGSLKACSDIPGDACETPWDYCCETDKLPTGTALVKVVDENGTLIDTDARKLLPVKELSTVVVQGKAQRDEAGNLTVLATGIFVK